ncbi:MAG: Tol-Pal system beta propeller repeat protein TolB [Thermodesulfovibrionales bacterium]|nr:Tol-Pal system beta propeller repeat protein TolB [Thermodesulfovibrionales bacterium]
MRIKLKEKSEKLKVESERLKVYLLFFFFSLFTFYSSLFTCEAKVYIDITSPGMKKMAIAIQEFSGPSGHEVPEIVRDDLEFTGLFTPVDKNAYLENPEQAFSQKNWTPLGVEAVVKGSVRGTTELQITIMLYDVYEAKEILRKEYRARKELLRPLSHSIANDIYFALTGEKGIFRSRIAFIRSEKEVKSLCSMDWDGNRIMNTGLEGNILLAPRWSRDAKRLVYSAERNRQWGIYLLDFTSMREKQVYAATGTNIAGDFFPDGSEVVFSSSKEGTPDIYRMNLDAGKPAKLTSSYGIEVSPSVSPDGKYIAFVSDKGGSPQIYLMRKDGSDVRRLTYEGSYNTSPSWSPKGDKIAFSGRTGGNQIFIINSDGTGLAQLTAQGNNEEPSFSPDGRYITFMSDRDGIKGIYRMRANGEAQQRIIPKGMKASGPRWSPN